MCANVRLKTNIPKIQKRVMVPQAVPYKAQGHQTAPTGIWNCSTEPGGFSLCCYRLPAPL